MPTDHFAAAGTKSDPTNKAYIYATGLLEKQLNDLYTVKFPSIQSRAISNGNGEILVQAWVGTENGLGVML